MSIPDPIDYYCPHCKAGPKQRCTPNKLGDTYPLHWYHEARRHFRDGYVAGATDKTVQFTEKVKRVLTEELAEVTTNPPTQPHKTKRIVRSA